MTRVDIAIIGSGPAGLEAALTAKNRNPFRSLAQKIYLTRCR